MTEAIRWFQDLSLKDTDSAGGKGANLGELTRAGIPVPPGFVVTAGAFRQFRLAAGLEPGLSERVAALDVDNGPALRQVSETLRGAVLAAPLPAELHDAVVAAYADLARQADDPAPLVAVRSSATVEDMPGTSFAGMNESYLNVCGADALLDAVRRCWASLYGARVLFYRRKQGIAEEKVAIAVVVQQMIESEASGVMFTVNPATGSRDEIVIEGAFGLGDTVVSGAVSPDHWEVDKKTGQIRVDRPALKHVISERDAAGETRVRPLSDEEGGRPCLNPEQVGEVAALGSRIEGHYGAAQDIEWALAAGRLWIVQSRPVTAVAGEEGAEIVRGLPASPGIGSGIARVLLTLEESERLEKGDVLVARRTEPDWVPLMKRASAIVTDEGGMTAHAAIVSRELGIPCIVGAQEATAKIPDGAEVTVDARQGIVRRGRPAAESAPAAPAAAPARPSPPVTATRLYANLGQPEMAERVAQEDVDGIGLLRIEFLVLAVANNVHPRQLLQQGRGEALRDGLAEGMARFARAFAPRIVVARTTDFRTNEYRNMTGGDAFEPHEENPMIGYRGVFRYRAEPDLFRLELDAFKTVRQEWGLKNLALMLPFVRTLSELRDCRRQIEEAGLFDDPSFPFWIMAEVPSVIYRLPEYVKEGVTGVSIGSNDLTQLMLGIDRDSEALAPLFDERDPAVLAAIRDIIIACRKLGITCSLCGQAPSVYPEIAEKLVAWGIDSISVNPDVIDRTRRAIAAAEQRVLLNAVREGRE